jgi:hypothetical protein
MLIPDGVDRRIVVAGYSGAELFFRGFMVFLVSARQIFNGFNRR